MNNIDETHLYDNLFKQCLTLWINPEIEKRKSENRLPDKFIIKRVQIILPLGSTPTVRFNEEVKVIVKAKCNKAIKKGDVIYESDVDSIEDIRLTEEETDFGHITMIVFKNHWLISFSFLYDQKKSKEFYEIGESFLESANKDLEAKNYRPFVESLSVAAENYAKSRLYLLPDLEVRTLKKHDSLKSRVCWYSMKGNIINKEFKDSFTTLLFLRDKARYKKDFTLNQNEAEKIFQSVIIFKNDLMKWLLFD